MPKGVYERKKRKAGAGESTPPDSSTITTKKTRKKRAPNGSAARSLRAMAGEVARREASAGAARFGVFSDGSVQIDAPECKGNLSCEDVDLLYAFVSKLREVRK